MQEIQAVEFMLELKKLISYEQKPECVCDAADYHKSLIDCMVVVFNMYLSKLSAIEHVSESNDVYEEESKLLKAELRQLKFEYSKIEQESKRLGGLLQKSLDKNEEQKIMLEMLNEELTHLKSIKMENLSETLKTEENHVTESSSTTNIEAAVKKMSVGNEELGGQSPNDSIKNSTSTIKNTFCFDEASSPEKNKEINETLETKPTPESFRAPHSSESQIDSSTGKNKSPPKAGIHSVDTLDLAISNMDDLLEDITNYEEAIIKEIVDIRSSIKTDESFLPLNEMKNSNEEHENSNQIEPESKEETEKQSKKGGKKSKYSKRKNKSYVQTINSRMNKIDMGFATISSKKKLADFDSAETLDSYLKKGLTDTDSKKQSTDTPPET